jgi:hypothetical protein
VQWSTAGVAILAAVATSNQQVTELKDDPAFESHSPNNLPEPSQDISELASEERVELAQLSRQVIPDALFAIE